MSEIEIKDTLSNEVFNEAISLMREKEHRDAMKRIHIKLFKWWLYRTNNQRKSNDQT